MRAYFADIFTKPKDISKHSDEMQAMWVVAEDEMLTILRDGLVPSSSIKSGGRLCISIFIVSAVCN